MFGFSARTLCVYLTIVGLLVFYNYVIFRQFWRSFSGILSLSNIIGEQDGFMANRFHLSPSDHAFRPPETRYYEMLVQHEIRWPNGVERRVITINGRFPGPSIEARSGDVLHITVRNNLSDVEGTSLHWHGLKMRGYNSQDGTPGVTQCPIAPGSTYTYSFQIDPEQSGTFWYHSHSSGQRTEGLFGALIVYSPSEQDPSSPHVLGHEPQDLIKARRERISHIMGRGSLPPNNTMRVGSMEYDEDIVLLLHDWYHRTAEETLRWFKSERSLGREPVPDDVLLNGQQSYQCERSIRKINCDPLKGSTPRLELDPRKRYRFRLVNAGSIATVHFSIDSHRLILIEADGTLISPLLLKEITLAPGQRYSVVLVPLDVENLGSRSFVLRLRLDPSDFAYPNSALDLEPKGTVYYRPSISKNYSSQKRYIEERYSSSPEVQPSNNATMQDLVASDPVGFDALSLMALGETVTLPAPDETIVIYVATLMRKKFAESPRGFVNNTSWNPAVNRPLLSLSSSQRKAGDWGDDQFVVSVGNGNRAMVVDIIVNNLELGDHPFHLHGHHFYPLQTHSAQMGYGSYNKAYAPPLPRIAPALRDTFVIPSRGYAIFRVVFDNPGLWAFHCHNTYHLQTGMAMIFEVMGNQIRDVEVKSVRSSCLKR